MIKITLLPDGPILINNDRSGIALCRCGQTTNPTGLCSGEHTKCGFEAKAGEVVTTGEHISLEVSEDEAK